MLWIIVLVLFAIIVIAVLAFLFFRTNQAHLQSGFHILKESFESLQKNILLLQEKTERSLENRVVGMDNKLDLRLKELASGVQSKLEENLKEGFRHFEKVQQHLKLAETQLQNLNTVGQSINDLNNLLKLPHLRGSFGEATLERMLSDLLPAGAFELQYRVTPASTERVDAVIKYPNCVLPIDSKFPREQILPLFDSHEPERLEAARKDLGDVIKIVARQIKEKYIRPEHGTTEMALLFIPSETLYFEVLRNVKLCEDLGRLKVFPVSPNTLAVTLHAFTAARNYYDMAKGVEKLIEEIRKAQLHFDNFERKFAELGASLNRAQTAFNTATTHLSRYESAVTRLTGKEPSADPLAPIAD